MMSFFGALGTVGFGPACWTRASRALRKASIFCCRSKVFCACVVGLVAEGVEGVEAPVDVVAEGALGTVMTSAAAFAFFSAKSRAILSLRSSCFFAMASA